MKIESIRLKNFKTFRDAHLRDLPDFCVVVGANGSGKSTLFDVFGFLHDCLKGNVRQALDARGRFQELISRDSKEDSILIELQYRMEIVGVDRLVTYSLEIGEKKATPFVKREILRYKRGRHGKPYHVLDFERGRGYAITNEEDFNQPDEELTRENQTLDAPDILAIKGLGQFERFKAANAFRRLIESWHVSDFHIEAARGRKEAAGESEHLSETGDNLPARCSVSLRTPSAGVRKDSVHDGASRPGRQDDRAATDGQRLPDAKVSGRVVQDAVPGSIRVGRHDQDVRVSCVALQP